MTRGLAVGGLLFVVSFCVRSLYAVDLAPSMYSHRQPGTRMSARYDESAVSILQGAGVLFPARPDPDDTGLLARPPGYAVCLAGIYAVLGRSYFVVQLVQNAVNSATPVLIFLIAARLLGGRVGAVAGLLAALSPPLAFASNLVLPDSLCALPVLIAMGLVVAAPATTETRRGWPWFAAAGACLGLAVWLRPNVLLLPPFLAVLLVAISERPRTTAKRAAVLVLVSFAVVAPITIRNYALFGELVPVSINGGITLWQGVAAAGGQRFGARTRDKLVIAEEALAFQNAAYEEWWAAPDGIRRDRLRYRMALGVIREHPLWYGKAMLRRMAEMVRYDSDTPPLVDVRDPDNGDRALSAGDRHGEAVAAGEGSGAPDLRPRISSATLLAPGQLARPLRVPLSAAQAVTNTAMLPLLFAGAAVVVWTAWRTAALILIVPLYYFLFESMFIWEWRVAVPMHYWLFVLAAAPWTVAGTAFRAAVRYLARRLSPGQNQAG